MLRRARADDAVTAHTQMWNQNGLTPHTRASFYVPLATSQSRVRPVQRASAVCWPWCPLACGCRASMTWMSGRPFCGPCRPLLPQTHASHRCLAMPRQSLNMRERKSSHDEHYVTSFSVADFPTISAIAIRRVNEIYTGGHSCANNGDTFGPSRPVREPHVSARAKA